jgi:hypothetical protein
MPALGVNATSEERTAGRFSFTLLLRGVDPLEHLDPLFEAGCDDAVFGEREGSYYAEFDREAPSFVAAIESSIRQVEGAVPGLSVVRIEPDELVSAAAIAERTGRSRESIRLLVDHQRGPGGFPPPLGWVNAKTRLWRWSDVADWFVGAFGDEPLGSNRDAVARSSFLGAVNSVLELRNYAARIDGPAARSVIQWLITDIPLAPSPGFERTHRTSGFMSNAASRVPKAQLNRYHITLPEMPSEQRLRQPSRVRRATYLQFAAA